MKTAEFAVTFIWHCRPGMS